MEIRWTSFFSPMLIQNNRAISFRWECPTLWKWCWVDRFQTCPGITVAWWQIRQICSQLTSCQSERNTVVLAAAILELDTTKWLQSKCILSKASHIREPSRNRQSVNRVCCELVRLINNNNKSDNHYLPWEHLCDWATDSKSWDHGEESNCREDVPQLATIATWAF